MQLTKNRWSTFTSE